MQEHLNSLAPQTDNKIAELGFGLLGVAVDLDNRKLGKLLDYSDFIQSNLQIILEKTERICSNLQDVFSKMLKVVKANKSDEYARALSTNFKTLSYFAALWYLDPDSPEYRHTLRNIKGHYLLDALRESGAPPATSASSSISQAIKNATTLPPLTNANSNPLSTNGFHPTRREFGSMGRPRRSSLFMPI